ncbi:MAG: phosphotransferase [Oscillospiraceae bacterium]|jgi:serine/threonine-protein kinase|nr:phosphotransferase [Oscillospiraceae bacterium]
MLDRFSDITPLEKGYSGDKKYIVTRGGDKLLLRVCDIAEYERKRAEFAAMQRCAETGILMSVPLELDARDGCVYSLFTYIDGEDAEAALPKLTEERQYALGVKAGKILRKIHSIPAPDGAEPWDVRFSRKIERNLRWYEECPIKYPDGARFIKYLEDNRRLLKNRPQTFQHGDYHCGNMIVTTSGELGIIDFNRLDFGDPWEEFNRIVWCAAVSGRFASGRVDGYFGDEVPELFWRLLAFYIASNTLGSIYWSIPFGQGEIDTMMNQAANVLEWYNGMESVVPTWYQKYV